MRSSASVRKVARVLTAVGLVAAGLLWTGGPQAAAAQTPFTSVGLGYPVPPVDARAAALGGSGVGLLYGTFSIRNPADLVEFHDATLSVSASPEAVDVLGPGVKDATGRSRFSAIRAVVPAGGFTFAAGFGSELDQDWSFEFQDTLRIAAGDFPFDELRRHDGGLSHVDLSVARSLGPLSLGVSYQNLTGNLRQSFRRRFQSPEDIPAEAPASVEDRAEWNFSGNRFKVGAGLSLGDRVRVSGSYGITGTLDADRAEEGETATRSFDMPNTVEFGGSVRIFGDLLAAFGGGWARWSDLDGSLGETRARDSSWLGGGLELRDVEVGPLPATFRAGGRHTELPFSLADRQQATETAFTAGLGTSLARGRLSLDAALETGSRGDLGTAGLEESFRRFSFTASLRQ